MEFGFQVLLLLLATMILGSFSVTFTFTNNCQGYVYPGIVTNAGRPEFPITGFQLLNQDGSQQVFEVPKDWAGRIWGRYFCSIIGEKLKCATGECASGDRVECNGAGGAPPASIAEFTLEGSGSGLDYYDISLVDGFNLPMSVESGCGATTCSADVNLICPPELSVKDPDGITTIACKSACLAFKKPMYCCTLEYGFPDKCHPSNYSMVFKNACSSAYTYAYDDKTSIFTCPSGSDFRITFCPAPPDPTSG